MLLLYLKNRKCKISIIVFIAEEMFLAVTLVGGENGDAVCLWTGDSQERISSAMNTIILIFAFSVLLF